MLECVQSLLTKTKILILYVEMLGLKVSDEKSSFKIASLDLLNLMCSVMTIKLVLDGIKLFISAMSAVCCLTGCTVMICYKPYDHDSLDMQSTFLEISPERN